MKNDVEIKLKMVVVEDSYDMHWKVITLFVGSELRLSSFFLAEEKVQEVV